MAEVLRSPSHFPSSPRRPLSCHSDDGFSGLLSPCSGIEECEAEEERPSGGGGGSCEIERKRGRRKSCGGGGGGTDGEGEEDEQRWQHMSVLALFLTVFQKSLLGCETDGAGGEDFNSMQIGWPTEVRHVAHVTFDRFHGFLGLPVEFEPEVPRRAPSASATVFGVSTESIQCSYDARGNSDAMPNRRRLCRTCEFAATDRGCSIGLGCQFDGRRCLGRTNKQDECTQHCHSVCSKHDADGRSFDCTDACSTSDELPEDAILKTLKERQDPTLDDASLSNADPSDENGHAGPELHLESCRKEATEHVIDESPLTSLNDASTEGMASCCEQESSANGSGIVHANSHGKKAQPNPQPESREGKKGKRTTNR
ncbi:hypothetical protein ZIOFF_061616 [Zingiber officinale]|uniref:CRIB domain-containing protein n=1 Tax=Zingiber officinale TaxID=94328 RepID=A0A8J5KIH4_ZINOF|nr:hypothetical protein ZIOFF_061616 [Zingiber officinale]